MEKDSKPLIWIVDDELIIGLHLAQFFEERGYPAEPIKSGESCLERIESGQPPELILMDINLGPGRLTGPETTRLIHESREIPVVLHSAYTDSATLRSTENMVKYGYVQKVPGNENFVLATVEMALKLHAVEQALRERERMYRDLSNHLQRVREEQSAYMAREIHDDLGQSLAALKMNLTMIAKSVEDPHIEPFVTDMREILDETVSKVRAMVQELRPPVLDTTGILEALRWHTREFQKSFGLTTSFSSEIEELQLGKECSLATFRIVQEALTNSVRHGEPTEVSVSVKRGQDGALEVTIRDNGKGFDLSAGASRGGFGLLSMGERAEQVGGVVEIETAPGAGTTVRARIPVEEA
ncbi:MAG: ATP-binding protein [Spirochaetaceae bacterium]